MNDITGNDPNIGDPNYIGGGGNGRVYQLKAVNNGKLFAKKTIHMERDIHRKDIDNEAKAISKLRSLGGHRNVVHIFRHGWLSYATTGNVLPPVYYVDMELGDGSLDAVEIWEIMQHIAGGLKYLHQHRLVHRDLKPANIIRSWYKRTDGERDWKIADFGISTAGSSQSLFFTTRRRGTILYCAPEIQSTDSLIPSYTNKVDIYGLGLILYELCTGERAFGTESDVTKYAHNEGPCPQIDESESVHLSNVSSEFIQEKEAVTLIGEIWKAGNEIFADNTRVLPSLAYDNLRNRHGVSMPG